MDWFILLDTCIYKMYRYLYSELFYVTIKAIAEFQM